MAEILVFCAHPDDEIFGVGGTIAKYAKEGKETVTVICSDGESSHPWLKEEYKIRMRREESTKAGNIVKAKETIFLGLRDGKLNKDMNTRGNLLRIKEIIKKEKPKKIFTHSIDDPHPDHRGVFRAVKKALSKPQYRGALYSFEIWNIANLKKRHLPKMYVDISKTMPLKIKALKMFRSQIGSLIPLLPAVYVKSFFAGLHAHCKYAEVFYKVD